MTNRFAIDLAGQTPDRRWVLKSIAGLGSLLIVGCDEDSSSEVKLGERLTPFIEIAPDNTITLTPPEAEMGQGVFTSLAQILAEELDVDWSQVRVRIAPHNAALYNVFGTQATGNSNSVRIWYQPLRRIGASMRAVLLQAAANEWNVDVADCRTEKGVVIHKASERRLDYGALADAASRLELPDEPVLKSANDFRYIGHSLKRRDTPPKVNGEAMFGADVRLPGQVYAALRFCPIFGGRLKRAGNESAPDYSGVIDIVSFENSVAVVADSWWRANETLNSIAIDFESETVDLATNTSLESELFDLIETKDGLVAASIGASVEAPVTGSVTVSARYAVPYLAHMCMEPMTATVWVKDDGVEAYAPTQSPERFAKRIAVLTDIDLDRVTFSNTFLGGGLGRKGLDFSALDHATLLSMRLGRPVQVIVDRETDTQQDQYRPAAAYRYDAILGDGGVLESLTCKTASPSIRRQRFPEFYAPDEVDPNGVYGLQDFFYQTNFLDVRWIEAESPIPVGYWRAVGRSNTPFAKESFVDELAHAAQQDPLAYRQLLLGQRDRHRRVLDAVAQAAGWGRTSEPGRGMGIAIQDGWGSICAQVAEVSVRGADLIVEHIWAAVDCGRTISPDQVEAQIVSGILDGMGAALSGQVLIEEGRVAQSNFHDYAVTTLDQAPEISVTIIDSNEPPGGVGELGVPACAPAIANALFAATGFRARTLPLARHAPFA